MVLPLFMFNNNILYFMWTIIKKFHHGTSVQHAMLWEGGLGQITLCAARRRGFSGGVISVHHAKRSPFKAPDGRCRQLQARESKSCAWPAPNTKGSIQYTGYRI
jgi:hypothetical protein